MIRIDDDFFIESDAYEWRVMKSLHKTDKTGKEMSKCYGHYASLVSALSGLYRRLGREVMAEGEYSLSEAVAQLKTIELKLEKELKKVNA